MKAKALLVMACPACENPCTVTVPTAAHVDEHGQAYVYLACARCRTELQVMLAAVKPDPYLAMADNA